MRHNWVLMHVTAIRPLADGQQMSAPLYIRVQNNWLKERGRETHLGLDACWVPSGPLLTASS